MSQLPPRGSLRRPVRALRQLAQRHRSDQPQERHHRHHSGAQGDLPLVSPPRPMGGEAEPLDSRRPQGVENQCLWPVQIVDRPWPAAPCREPRPQLGRARARRGRRGQGALRMVRRSYRIHLQHQGAAPRQLGALLERPRDTHHQLHRQGQHRIPLHHIPRHAHGLRRRIPAPRQCAC